MANLDPANAVGRCELDRSRAVFSSSFIIPTDLAETEVVKTTVSLTKVSGVVPVTSSHWAGIVPPVTPINQHRCCTPQCAPSSVILPILHSCACDVLCDILAVLSQCDQLIVPRLCPWTPLGASVLKTSLLPVNQHRCCNAGSEPSSVILPDITRPTQRHLAVISTQMHCH